VIKIYGGACFYDGTEHLPTYTLFQRLGVNFVQCKQADNKAVYEVLPPTFDGTKKRFNAVKEKLTRDALSAAVGSNKIILGEFDEWYSIYTIKTIDGEPCSEAVSCEKNSLKDPLSERTLLMQEWETLENLAASGLLR